MLFLAYVIITRLAVLGTIAVEGAYAIYWLCGVWAPWWIDALTALIPATPFVWLILLVLHATPVHFPVLH
jgi:hypothetical protein